MPKKMFLIDGSNHAFRVQYALPPMNASDGFPTRALYGFTNLFAKILREHKPDYVVVSFDKGKTFRHEMYPDYKGHRPDMPEDLRQQWPHFPELVVGFGYNCVIQPGFEADDVMGTLARQFASPDIHVYLLTGDKDLWQLINDNVTVLDIQKNKFIEREQVVEQFGVGPEGVIDIKGLAGDSSDNIPGIPGIGPKKASQYLKKFGTLEGVLANHEAIGGKTGQKVLEFAEDARISKRLATIDTEVELGLELADLEPRGLQEDDLRELFDKWDFGQVARRLLPDRPVLDPTTWSAIGTTDALSEFLATAKAAGTVAYDLETSSSDSATATLMGLSICTGAHTAYIPLQGRFEIDDSALALQMIGAFFADAEVSKLGHGVKANVHLLRRLGIDLQGIAGDVLIADYVLVSHEKHTLDAMSTRYLGHTLSAVDVVADLFAGMMSLDETVAAQAERANLVWILHDKLLRRMAKGARHVYEEIEVPLLPILAQMEATGIALDKSVFVEIEADLGGRLKLAEKACHDALGRSFNVGSRVELQAILFDELGLPPSKKVKGGYSTDASVLEQLLDQHALPGLILDYRKLQKLLSTYVTTLPGFVKDDGRIHSTFRQAVAATGRLASHEPNLQNIPIRTFEGRRLRDGFVPKPGHVFLSADYSQIELRVLAHLCGEGPLVESFNAGTDIHTRTASEVFGVPADEVTIALRSAAKTINFGLLYGMSAFRLARDLKISRGEAQQFMDDYFGRMPQVKTWMDDTKARARKIGSVETMFGRRRIISTIHSKRYQERMAAEREAMNTPVQGTAADLIKIAMIRVHNALHKANSGAKILLQVHDELLLEVPESDVEGVRDLVVREMMGAADLAVPLEVNTAVGHTWNEAHG